MPGNAKGGAKARETNRERHGADFYARIGAKGGSKKGVKKGFAANPDLARRAGAQGGRISRRGAVKAEVVVVATPVTASLSQQDVDIAA